MKRYLALLLFCSVGMTACRQSSAPTETPAPVTLQSAQPVPVFDPAVPPTHKEILRALLNMQNVPLSSDTSCSSVGTDVKDTDIGDYLSGFLAEQDSAKGGNWLDVSAVKETSTDGEPVWRAAVTIYHSAGEDVWGWGAAFQMRAKDHVVIKGSVRCTGAG